MCTRVHFKPVEKHHHNINKTQQNIVCYKTCSFESCPSAVSNFKVPFLISTDWSSMNKEHWYFIEETWNNKQVASRYHLGYKVSSIDLTTNGYQWDCTQVSMTNLSWHRPQKHSRCQSVLSVASYTAHCQPHPGSFWKPHPHPGSFWLTSTGSWSCHILPPKAMKMFGMTHPKGTRYLISKICTGSLCNVSIFEGKAR